MSHRRFFGYVLAGGSAAVIDLGIFVLLVGQDTRIPLAALMSFSAAAVWNYAISSRFVFQQRPTGRAFSLFIALALMGAGLNSTITWYAVTQGTTPAIGKLFGIGAAFLINYAANSLIVFRSGLSVDRRL